MEKNTTKIKLKKNSETDSRMVVARLRKRRNGELEFNEYRVSVGEEGKVLEMGVSGPLTICFICIFSIMKLLIQHIQELWVWSRSAPHFLGLVPFPPIEQIFLMKSVFENYLFYEHALALIQWLSVFQR